jgi:hypothetical protein
LSLVLHINGWPGCGKLTIGRLVAERLGARFVDNHALLNPAEALFERNNPLHRELRYKIRETFFAYAARLAPDASIVFTDALADDPGDAATFDEYRTFAGARSSRLISAVLDCDLDENLRRLARPGRAEQRKLTRAAVLEDLRAKYRLLKPDDVERIDLDVTHLSADAAAAALLERLQPVGWAERSEAHAGVAAPE